jgi:(2Fe-2S) ferredoxin
MINNEHWHERLQPEDAAAFVEALRAKGLAAVSGCHHRKE